MPVQKKRDYIFEFYIDKKGESRTRIKHWNGNIIYDSGEGYKTARSRKVVTANFIEAIQAGRYKIITIFAKKKTLKK